MPQKSMTFLSHRYAATRNFDCLYDPNYTVPSEKDVRQASHKALANSTPVQIRTKYDEMFTDTPRSARMTFHKQKMASPYNTSETPPKLSPSIVAVLNKCSDLVARVDVPRMEGGGGGTSTPVGCKLERKLPPSPRPCKQKPPGLQMKDTQVKANVIHVKLSENAVASHLQHRHECDYGKQTAKKPFKQTRGTQTLYRESSAQTLPFLPGVSNDKEYLETLELFKLPTILPGDGPPGIYEVEVLERARKRWAFFRAIKERHECQRQEMRREMQKFMEMPPHKKVLDAFEWTHWLEREEYIQDCQMMRFELVIRMFDKREKQMHDSSMSRIEHSYERILAKRDAGLRKNEIEYGREMRRLRIKHDKRPRNYRKEKISTQLGDPSSDFYAPQMRYGVNPNRRHFEADRRGFEARMDELEKCTVNMKNLVCSHAKFKEWSKPKQRMIEVEQNFCKDTNLKKLYESLKGLRQQSTKQKIVPKCLIEKHKPKSEEECGEECESAEYDHLVEQHFEETSEEPQEVLRRVFSHDSLEELGQQKAKERDEMIQHLSDRLQEEIECLLAEYEGTSIGWLMVFLSDEMSRLQEQRKLHFITMLAQKERWRREAAEAGLRQKENEMRKLYERIFQEANKGNEDVCDTYLHNILHVDVRDDAEHKAIESVTQTARLVDNDIQRWLVSIRTIQNPLNYDALRCILRDIVFPDWNACCLMKKREAELIAEYIINDVLLHDIFAILLPYDITKSITDEMIDRLIDNDLYYFTPECSSDCDCDDICECPPSATEARAILRKVIRHAVPGRRWRTSTERIAHENVQDLLDGTLGPMPEYCDVRDIETKRRSIHSAKHLKLFDTSATSCVYVSSSKSSSGSRPLSSGELLPAKVTTYRISPIADTPSAFTKDLINLDKAQNLTTDESSHLISDFVSTMNYDRKRDSVKSTPTHLHYITSTYDILSTRNDFSQRASLLPSTSTSTIESEPPRELRSQIYSEVDSPDESDSMKHFINNLIDEVVYEGLAADSDAPETSDDTIKRTTREILNEVVRVMQRSDIFDQYEPSTSDNVEEAVHASHEDELSGYELVINESEIELMEMDRCKCSFELEREAYVKKMIKLGKVKIIPKVPVKEETELEVLAEDSSQTAATASTFEYISSVELLTRLPGCHEDDYLKEMGVERTGKDSAVSKQASIVEETMQQVMVDEDTTTRHTIVDDGEQATTSGAAGMQQEILETETAEMQIENAAATAEEMEEVKETVVEAGEEITTTVEPEATKDEEMNVVEDVRTQEEEKPIIEAEPAPAEETHATEDATTEPPVEVEQAETAVTNVEPTTNNESPVEVTGAAEANADAE